MAKNIKNKIQDIRKALNAAVLERTSLIDGALVALLSREHLFVLGPPGTAKSYVVQLLCSAIGGKYYEILMSKVTTPDELFGSISIAGLKNDRYKRITSGKLPEADIAFVDEVFKGGSSILNSLLGIMNERRFHNDGPTAVPLQSLFGASNEVPQSDELGAMYDRFALRFVVNRLQDDASVETVLFSGAAPAIPSISLEELAVEQAAAAAVVIPAATVKLLVQLRKLIHNEGIYVSDRKWKQTVKIVKAFAHLNGNTEVQDTDLEILENVLWCDPAQFKQVRRLVSKIANPVGEEIVSLTDAVAEIHDNLLKGQIQPVDAVNKIKAAIRALEKLGPVDKNPKLAAAVAATKTLQKQILVSHLGLE